MSIEQTIFGLINPLVSGGLYPAIAPQGVSKPYAVYCEPSGIPENTLSDGAGLQNSLIQITVWDTTYLGAKTLGEAIAGALASAFSAGTLSGWQRGRRSTYEQDTALHGIIYEFSLWYH